MFHKGRTARPPAPAAGPADHGSPAMARVAEHLARGGRHQVLDFGRALQHNLDFLSRFPTRIFFEPLEDTLAELRAIAAQAESDSAPPPPPFGGLFAYPAEVRFDLILAWDLFDYLEPEHIAALRERLSPHLASDCLLFCLVSNQAEIPAAPQRYRILSEDRLAYEPQGPARIPGRQHSALALKTRLPDFSLERSFLLRNGMQEYLFLYRGH
jgi:hypothetical protein